MPISYRLGINSQNTPLREHYTLKIAQSRESSDKEEIPKNLLTQASAEPTASEVELLLGEKQLPLSNAKTRNL